MATRKAKLKAVMVVCPGVTNEGLFGHSMRDGCSSCAPFWEQYPVCPKVAGGKLSSTLWCAACKTHHSPGDRIDLRVESIKRVVGKPNKLDEVSKCLT